MLDPCQRITGIAFFERHGHGITDIQLGYADGSWSDRAFADSEAQQVAPGLSTHRLAIPDDESFEGLRLKVQPPRLGWDERFGVIDLSVMLTGWLTNNPEPAETRALRWTRDGIDAIILKEQSSATHNWGLVDIGVRRAGGGTDWITSNRSACREHTIELRGRTIVGLQVWEMPFHGLIDLATIFHDGSDSERGFADSVHLCGGRGSHVWERTIPMQTHICGLDARVQAGFGLTDLLVRTGPHTAPDDFGAWLVVDAEAGAGGTDGGPRGGGLGVARERSRSSRARSASPATAP